MLHVALSVLQEAVDDTVSETGCGPRPTHRYRWKDVSFACLERTVCKEDVAGMYI